MAMPPWHHPCFANIGLEINFTCGNKIRKTRQGVFEGRRGNVIREIYVLVFVDIYVGYKLDEEDICNIFSEYYEVVAENIHIFSVYAAASNSLIFYDSFAINDVMI